MRNAFSRFKEEFSENVATDIAVELGLAIREDDVDAIDKIVSKYFSTPSTAILLNGAIAAFVKKDKFQGFYPPAILALMLGKRDALRAILQITGNPNVRENPDDPEHSPTLLIMAVQNSDIETVKLLLDAGANLNEEWIYTKNSNEIYTWTALTLAIIDGLSKTIDILLEAGAIPTPMNALQTILDDDDYSQNLEKIIALHPELVNKQFFTAGADNSLLSVAVLYGKLSFVRGLIEQGANFNMTVDGLTPLDIAISQDYDDIAQFLRSVGGLPSKQDESPELQNSSAAKKEITEIIERLELLEEKFGIAISGIYASCEETPWNRPTGDYRVIVNFDISSLNGDALARSLHICASAYNSAGQLLSKQQSHIDKDDFAGFASIDITLYLDQMPERIRLFPTV